MMTILQRASFQHALRKLGYDDAMMADASEFTCGCRLEKKKVYQSKVSNHDLTEYAI